MWQAPRNNGYLSHPFDFDAYVMKFSILQGVPASVQIFASGNASQSQPVARRSFFRCSTTQLKWNHGSTGLLVVVQSDFDKTNQSYYGESKLCYLTTDGMHEGLVPLRMFFLLVK